MKLNKKIIVCILMVFIILSGVIKCYATEQVNSSETFTYEVRNISGKKYVCIKKFYSNGEKNVVIPSTINGVEVGIIDSLAFQNLADMETVTIPETVFLVNKNAFDSCANLKKVIIGNPNSIYNEKTGGVGFIESFIECPNITELVEYSYAYNLVRKDNFVNGTIPKTVYAHRGSESAKQAQLLELEFKPLVSFEDVNVKNWFYNSVKFCQNNDYIKGYNIKKFAPYDKLTRGMAITIIWRMAGEPNATIDKFPDVKQTDYYYTAINWAASQKIINGYDNGNFGPKDNVTREQLCSMLTNYARMNGKNMSFDINTDKYMDYSKISDGFKASIAWCIQNKVITGKDNGTKIDPKGFATRAEIATILSNFCNNVK